MPPEFIPREYNVAVFLRAALRNREREREAPVKEFYSHRHVRVKKAAKTEFDRWAGGYDRSILQRFLFKPAHDLILGEIDLAGSPQILDIGCGTCVFGFRIAALSPSSSIFCVDLSHEMAQRAKTKRDGMRRLAEETGTVRITLADSEHLPFTDNSIDYVTCANSFHHYPHPEGVVREMHRVLKPGGTALVVDGCRDTLPGRVIFDLIVTLMEGDVRHLSAGEFRGLFTSCGFTGVRQRTHLLGIPILLTAASAEK
jgi:SAM-dependent methyltransferase